MSFKVKCSPLQAFLAGRTGRVGNPGKAISFVDGDYDAELLTKLISADSVLTFPLLTG